MTVPRIEVASNAKTSLSAELDGRMLRISFTTGCGGSGYRLSSSADAVEGDTVIEVDSIRIALDSMAVRSLDGATIVLDEVEGGYLIDHPNAAISAWCG